MLLLVLAAASGALRQLLAGWRIVHAASYLTFALGLLHGLLAGTDAGSPFALVFYLTTLLVVGWATYRRRPSSKLPLHGNSKNVLARRDPWPLPDTTRGSGHAVPRLTEEAKGGANRARASRL